MGDKGSRSSEYVTDPKERMTKWKGRSDTLLKLTSELSTLCGTPACIVISCPNPNPNDHQFEVWPDDGGVSLRRMIDIYKSKTGLSSSPKKKNKNPSSLSVKGKRIKKYKQGVSYGGSSTKAPNMGQVQQGQQGSVLAVMDAKIGEVQATIEAIHRGKRPEAALDNVLINNETSDSTNNVVDAASEKERLSMMTTEVNFMGGDDFIKELINYSCLDNTYNITTNDRYQDDNTATKYGHNANVADQGAGAMILWKEAPVIHQLDTTAGTTNSAATTIKSLIHGSYGDSPL